MASRYDGDCRQTSGITPGRRGYVFRRHQCKRPRRESLSNGIRHGTRRRSRKSRRGLSLGRALTTICHRVRPYRVRDGRQTRCHPRRDDQRNIILRDFFMLREPGANLVSRATRGNVRRIRPRSENRDTNSDAKGSRQSRNVK